MGKYILARSAGFCFGVERSMKMAQSALEEGPCYCLGELIHNRDAVSELEQAGLRTIEDPAELPEGERVLIRAHGIGESVYADLEKRSARVIDATCPLVRRIHRIVRKASSEGRQVVVIGDSDHPEIRGICGWCRNAVVLPDAAAFEKWLVDHPESEEKPISVVFQTTQIRDNLVQIEKILKKLCTKAEIFDTICGATSERQGEATRLSELCDAMVVIGGAHSANSLHLAELCRKRCGKVQFVPSADAVDADSLRGAALIGITAGASVPSRIIKEVVNKMCDEMKLEETVVEETAAPVAEEAAPAEVEAAAPVVEETAAKPDAEKSFDELLEDSIRTIYNGDTVSGYVVSITPTEVTVDLGTKHSGYIPVTEFTEDGAVKVEDVVHVGDRIEACVVRVNDVEGTVMLSKKRLDSIKSWSDVENAQADGTVVEGKVTEENKGGVVVNIRGIRVFVPASQTGLPRDAAMSELVGQTVRLKITEVNRGRKRVVGSIRAVANRERKERAEKIWNEIEVGKHYEGVVKSMTSYGAFVDIGGIDGMVHVSELSWNRVSKPADVLNIGDKIDVYVLGFDKENHKISLGHRNPDENPWKVFTDTYSVGDVAKVKIVKLMPFGAFAEVLPGTDGLIHISQIANRRIGQPSEVLSVGDVVDAKITNIDNEKQKISLSIRALSEPAPAPRREAEEEAEAAVEEPQADALVFSVDADGVTAGEAPAEE
ncbi:MAG: bifunctional 4-hydroxy-3-methylbut-2-enyl diphosphate reductase/30S ribosomal protein S1 [Oscillospiraceae bacterium]|nr:bifunctional 4-hydroxy-3-methylbut-2-enyl diphosphate reductase/30S ribosomal protein S1 [Oscillospiraceae bacterium]